MYILYTIFSWLWSIHICHFIYFWICSYQCLWDTALCFCFCENFVWLWKYSNAGFIEGVREYILRKLFNWQQICRYPTVYIFIILWLWDVNKWENLDPPWLKQPKHLVTVYIYIPSTKCYLELLGLWYSCWHLLCLARWSLCLLP